MERNAGVLAIDHGEKRTGFAVADALRIAANPLPGWRGPGGEAGLLGHMEELLTERSVSVDWGMTSFQFFSAGSRVSMAITRPRGALLFVLKKNTGPSLLINS